MDARKLLLEDDDEEAHAAKGAAKRPNVSAGVLRD